MSSPSWYRRLAVASVLTCAPFVRRDGLCRGVRRRRFRRRRGECRRYRQRDRTAAGGDRRADRDEPDPHRRRDLRRRVRDPARRRAARLHGGRRGRRGRRLRDAEYVRRHRARRPAKPPRVRRPSTPSQASSSGRRSTAADGWHPLRPSSPTRSTDEQRGAFASVVGNLQGAQTVYPDEPVGVGARWNVEQAVSGDSFPVTASYHYELTAIDDGRYTIAVSYSSTFDTVVDGVAAAGTVSGLGSINGSVGEPARRVVHPRPVDAFHSPAAPRSTSR